MKPLDPRLLRHARAARRYIVGVAVVGMLTAALVVAQALLVAHGVAPVVEGRAGWAHAAPFAAALAAVLAVRVVVHVVGESMAHRAARDVIAELREAVLRRAAALGPRRRLDDQDVLVLATRGLGDLEPYFVRYLPQLLLAATLTPATVVVIALLDLGSAAIIVVTIPLIPVFMWLIGVLTQNFAARRLVTMQRLGAQVLDLLAGLTTLKALGRERGPGTRITELGRAYTRTTMAALRVAFLSGAVLEFLASISVALVAVTIGMRLAYGHVGLTVALAVLMLAPEVYRPLREVGMHFHASADGVAAAERAFEVIDAEVPPTGDLPAPDLRRATIVLDDVSVAARGRWAPSGLSARIRPGTITAFVGPSGAGKSTSASLVLGLLEPDRGRLLVVPGRGDVAESGRDEADDADAVDLARIDPASWHAQIAWVPQRPVIEPGTAFDVVTARAGHTPLPAELDEAAALTGAAEVVAALPEGWLTRVGHGGVGLSLGQRQRLALTGAVLGGHALVVLDEPSAHLDATAEQRVHDTVRHLRARGATVLVIAHRRGLIALADEVIEVRARARDEGRSEERPTAADTLAAATGDGLV